MPKKSGKASHAGFVASIHRKAAYLESAVKLQDREILVLRRFASKTREGRDLLVDLRVARLRWLDEVRPEQRDVP